MPAPAPEAETLDRPERTDALDAVEMFERRRCRVLVVGVGVEVEVEDEAVRGEVAALPPPDECRSDGSTRALMRGVELVEPDAWSVLAMRAEAEGLQRPPPDPLNLEKRREWAAYPCLSSSRVCHCICILLVASLIVSQRCRSDGLRVEVLRASVVFVFEGEGEVQLQT